MNTSKLCKPPTHPVQLLPRTLPRPNCRLDCSAVLVRLIPSLLSVKWFISISHWHLIQVYASSVMSFLSPRTTSCGIQTLLCSSGQPWVEKIMVSQFLLSFYVRHLDLTHLGQTARLIFPSESGPPVLSTTVARICMHRPPPRITEAFPAHPGPSSTS